MRCTAFNRVKSNLDTGNVDIAEWHGAPRVNYLRDADRVMDAFYDFCHTAGPESCAFYEDAPGLIRKRLENLLEDIRRYPVIIPDSSSGPDMPELVTWSKLKAIIQSALYQPISLFQTFAKVLKALEERDGKPYWDFQNGGKRPTPACLVKSDPPDVPVDGEEGNNDAGNAINCADKWPGYRGSIEDLEDYARSLIEVSSSTGEINTSWMLACIGRKVKPKFRYGGNDSLHCRSSTHVLTRDRAVQGQHKPSHPLPLEHGGQRYAPCQCQE